MRRFATTLALLTIAFSTAACDPHRAITNALPEGCNPNRGPALSLDDEQASQAITASPAVNIPAESPNTNH